ncbi:LysR family transcriptional regulator [Aquabacterium sp. NJ1]|uniref:LysR substrate-binding domain-containing protein n=1 Tax=Aquabacterium sp. NJ1 TaxID=1538295 RepID=UPI00052CD208|nr:LysR substrate-binding domain-containing protein [Aquabacterium sp. NJ1]KGM39772.1 LysR family transcriptional regulator [Aquabacterium sp. NJ1]
MTLDQLRVFVAVAEEMNMRRASERVHLSQPAVSAAISALEERYALPLFDRVGRGLLLTEAGQLLLPEARAILARVQHARAMLTELAGLERGEVRIAASQTVATYWLPPRMARFATLVPKVRLTLQVGNTQCAVDQVLNAEADLAFIEGLVDAPNLEVAPVGADQIGLFAAVGHPLTRRRPRLRDLMNARWVMREQGSGTRVHLEEALSAAGCDIAALNVALELPSNGAVLEALPGSDLIAATSELAATARIQAGHLARVRWPVPARHFYMLTHRQRTLGKAAAAFVNATRDGASLA